VQARLRAWGHLPRCTVCRIRGDLARTLGDLALTHGGEPGLGGFLLFHRQCLRGAFPGRSARALSPSHCVVGAGLHPLSSCGPSSTAIEGLNLVRPGQLQASLVLRHALTSQGRLCQTFDLLKGSSCSG
jgi:hypothetical protein